MYMHTKRDGSIASSNKFSKIRGRRMHGYGFDPEKRKHNVKATNYNNYYMKQIYVHNFVRNLLQNTQVMMWHKNVIRHCHKTVKVLLSFKHCKMSYQNNCMQN